MFWPEQLDLVYKDHTMSALNASTTPATVAMSGTTIVCVAAVLVAAKQALGLELTHDMEYAVFSLWVIGLVTQVVSFGLAVNRWLHRDHVGQHVVS